MKGQSKNRLAFVASLNLSKLSDDYVFKIWTKYENGIHNSIRNHGKHYTLSIYKECYIFLRNTLLEIPTNPIPFCKVDSVGIPKPLWPLRSFIKKDREIQRLALCIARSYEQIYLEVNYEATTAITDPMTPEVEKQVSELSKTFESFLKRFTRKYQWYLGDITKPIEPWAKVTTSLSKGPNGPAVACSHLDAKAVTNDPTLANSITNLNKALGQVWITDWMYGQAEAFESTDSYHTGRLGFSSEPAGKTRIFAIGDYWSQLSLVRIQDSLYKTLKKIRMDATKDQDKGFKTLVAESSGRPTYCFDLSSASDRIPAAMQKYRLELLGGKELSESWHSVMTERDFYIKATKKTVRWKVGQPLGLLSSFPSFALWHHDIIQLSANWENVKKGKPLWMFEQYRLLGDDVVIFNTKVAHRYQWLLKQIGIEINLNKSIIGDSVNSQIEFAKRLSLRGKEMSSIRYNILQKNNRLYLLDLLSILNERDFVSTDIVHCNLSKILNWKDSRSFQYLMWLRVSSDPTLTVKGQDGETDLILTREDILQRIITKRTAKIIEKAMAIKPFCPVEDHQKMVKGFNSIGVSFSERTLVDRSDQNLHHLHPIMLALTQTSRQLQFMMFDVLDDIEPDNVCPIEYLPVVSTRSYYSSRKTTLLYLSELLLGCLDEALLSKTSSEHRETPV